MGKTFDVEIRTTCKVCSAPITVKRFRTYCSKACRDKTNQEKFYPAQRAWLRRNNDKKATVSSPDKKKCAICNLWYKRVARHVNQRHGMSAREYKELIDAPLRKGILAEDKRDYLRTLAKDQGFAEMGQKVGKETRFKKGDPKARVSTNKGRVFQETDYY